MPRRKPEPKEAVPPTQPETIETPVTQAPVTETKAVRLTGDELLAKQSSLADMTVKQRAYACGYFTTKVNAETGESKIIYSEKAFMAALLAAQGMSIPADTRPYSARSNRAPVVTVGGNGNIVVGKRYSIIAGFEPKTSIEVTAEAGRIVLTALAAESAEEPAEESEDEVDTSDDGLDDL